MKKVINKSVHLLIIAIVHLLINSSIFAQAPQKMSYQAVLRNGNDSLLISTPVGMRISLVQGSPTGTVVFSETQTATTNANGLVSLQIGMGTAVSGTFAGIDWAAGPYYVKTETDLSGGTNYTITSSNEILSVPYALFSANGTPGPSAYQVAVANGFSGTETQWLESLQGLSGPAGTFPPGTVAGEMNYWNGTAWVTVAPGSNNQNLTFCNGVPTWGPCPAAIPSITTTAVSLINNTSASSGGAVTSNGGAALTAWGVCWSTSANPTLANSFLQNNVSFSSFSSSLIGLTANTMYYVRAYATNSIGTAYGNEEIFITNLFPNIGGSYQGGILAYFLQPGDAGYNSTVPHGIIAASNDQSSAPWGCYNLLINGADGGGIGDGVQNTIDITNQCTQAGIAANICLELNINGFDDWYLPSIGELSYLFQNLFNQGLGNFTAGVSYWSSTETNSQFAVVYFSGNGGIVSNHYKHNNYPANVRAIRYF